jgi:hypothetical protein
VVELPTRLPIETLTPDYFYQKLLEDPSAPILIFIHGFNVPFIEAAQKAAQIKQDLKFQGPVVLWSWPAGAQEGLLQSTLLTRTYDENFKSAQASIPPFTDFLNRLLKEHAHLILMIHSMGHQVALPSILRLTPSVASDSQDKTQNKIQQLILNAPDYDMDQFADSLDRLHVKVEHITLYCSPYDKALQALFDGLNKVLTPEGVAMMTMTNPRFTMLEKWARSRSMGVEVFPRKRKQREALIRPHLKAVDGSNYPFEGSFTATIHTLARKDSPYPEFDGMYSEYHIEEQMENATPIPLPVSSQAVSESA